MKFLKHILLTLFLISSTNVIALPTAKITVKVVDDQGKPIEGANVGIGFRAPKSTGWGSKSSRVKGISDADGMFIGSNETEPYVTYSATKEGYYGTGGKFKDFKENTGIIGFRKWQPWNSIVELVLKEIKNPIPLYATKLGYEKQLEFPELNKFIGYDLVARDWVVPYGLGTHRDFLFKLEGEFNPSTMYVDKTLTIKFDNPLDGIQSIFAEPEKGSILRLSHHAPMNGYKPELVQRSKRDRKKKYISYKRDDQNYYFRVRTKTDDKGNIVSALYGKIHGMISFAIGSLREPKRSSLNFTYYLNPTSNDTNLEFDPKKNLFKNLTQSEEVKRP